LAPQGASPRCLIKKQSTHTYGTVGHRGASGCQGARGCRGSRGRASDPPLISTKAYITHIMMNTTSTPHSPPPTHPKTQCPSKPLNRAARFFFIYPNQSRRRRLTRHSPHPHHPTRRRPPRQSRHRHPGPHPPPHHLQPSGPRLPQRPRRRL